MVSDENDNAKKLSKEEEAILAVIRLFVKPENLEEIYKFIDATDNLLLKVSGKSFADWKKEQKNSGAS